MNQGFWKNLKKPIIALAPMDGVTDAPFRSITAKYGKPSVMLTEFTSVEGMCVGATKMLPAFIYDEVERPIIGQLFGANPEAFYKATFAICELGFDGVDINMGCPAKSVAARGAGASLILTPEVAKEIVRKSRQACEDWAEGKTMEDAGLHENTIAWVLQNRHGIAEKKVLPVSVKTRIGYDSITIEEWVRHLLEVEPVNISIHGRTLKQMYSGKADWEAIASAAKIIHQTETTVLGNGDIQSMEEAHQKIAQYGVDGVLVGRAAFGNPWLFNGTTADTEQRFKVAKEHTVIHEKIFGQTWFMPMRKHLAWYTKGFPGAAEVRQKLMKATSANDVDIILNSVTISGPALPSEGESSLNPSVQN